jgi:hypothetical protein
MKDTALATAPASASSEPPPPAAPALAYPSRRIQVYGISADELEQLENRGGSLVWTFFGIAFGAFLTSLAALLSGDSFGTTGLVILTAVAASGGFLSLLCFGIAVREQRRVGRLAKALRTDPGRLLADAKVVLSLLDSAGASAKPEAR